MIYGNLRNEMTKNKITQIAIAKFLGISANSLNMKIMGKTEFTMEEAQRIQKKFFPNLTLDFLFNKV